MTTLSEQLLQEQLTKIRTAHLSDFEQLVKLQNEKRLFIHHMEYAIESCATSCGMVDLFEPLYTLTERYKIGE